MPTNPRIELGCHHPVDNGPGIWIETPYSEGFIAELKEMVPWEHRAWDAEERRWFVRAPYAERVQDLVVFHFGETLIVDEAGNMGWRDADGTTAPQERLL